MELIEKRAGFHRFQLGALELTVVSDGYIVFDPPQPVLAPDTPAATFNRVLENYFLPIDQVTIALNILVIKKHWQTILIDAGAGPTMGGRSGWLLANLEIAGIQPGDVTDILLTHAHSDHIGGLLTVDGLPAFPNANVYMPQAEHDFWLKGAVDLSKSKLTDKAGFVDFSVPIVAAAKAALGSRLHFFEPDTEFFGFIKSVPTPGHTAGHTVYRVSDGGQTLFHMGDLTHHMLLFDHPEWGFEPDYNFEEGIATRKRILGMLADVRLHTFSIHLPWPGLGHVRRKGDAFEWVSEPFTSFYAG